jgi:DNA-binding LacI/PurR family transcriptional regulator
LRPRVGAKTPDAVFAGSDAIALGVMAAVHDAGLSVPGDVAVIGIDDIKAASFNWPSLSRVNSNPYEAGEAAANILTELMAGRTPENRKYLVKTRLVVRGSTRADFDRLT